jgi:hypothetical protein
MFSNSYFIFFLHNIICSVLNLNIYSFNIFIIKMKVFACLIFALAMTSMVLSTEPEHLEFLTESTPALKSINNPYQVYSMVWSGKYYNNRAEKKDFFFAIPMSFNTEMKIDTARKVISLNFVNYKSDMANFKSVLTDGPLALKSKFAPLITFSPDFSKIDLSMDFKAHPEFQFSLLHLYQNKDFRNVQFKITIPSSKVDRAFYITFDLFKQAVSGDDIQSFIDFAKSLNPKRVD